VTDNPCDKCYGTGYLDAGTDARGIPLTKPCPCQIAKDTVRNVNRAWAGLTSAPRLDRSPLTRYTGKNVYITATDATLRAHLRHVGLRNGPYWGFKVVTDSDMMTAWLSPIGLVGKEILDPDSASVSIEKATLVDLVDPPELLVIRLGVKSARNSAMGEVFLEALYHRSHVGKPTWVVDQPARRFDPSHLAFSEDGLHHIQQFPRVVLDDLQPGLSIEMVSGDTETEVPAPKAGTSLTLSAGYSSPGASVAQTTRIERPDPMPRKRNPKGFGK
jgi:hypothetical protein